MLSISKRTFGVDGVKLALGYSAGDVSSHSLSTGA